MTKRRKYITVTFIAVVFIGFLLIPVKSLGIYHMPDQKLLWAKNMIVGDQFTFSYIHSVSKTPIQEILEIRDDNKIGLNEVHYVDQGGAGMPEYTWENEIFENKNGEFVIKNFSREFSEVNLTIQPEFDDQLIFSDDKVDLDQLIHGKGNVQLKMENISVWKYSVMRLNNRFRKAR